MVAKSVTNFSNLFKGKVLGDVNDNKEYNYTQEGEGGG